MDNPNLKIILAAAGRFFAVVCLALLVPLAILIDTHYLGNSVGDASVTEYLQETLLALSALGFALVAYAKRPVARGFAILVAGFFAVMLIRELDALFDRVAHGFWLYPALAVTAATLLLAYRHRQDLLAEMASAAVSRSFIYITIGLAVVLFFSRLFGTGSLWRLVLDGATNTALVKTVVQEGLELFGYVLIFVGTAAYCREQELSRALRQPRHGTDASGLSPGLAPYDPVVNHRGSVVAITAFKHRTASFSGHARLHEASAEGREHQHAALGADQKQKLSQTAAQRAFGPAERNQPANSDSRLAVKPG